MADFASDFLSLMAARGYIQQCTDESGLDKAAKSGTITAYIGYDCTAPGLHVGNLISIMMLRKLQQTGHRPIIVIGGGTTKIGDPSGRDETRQLLTETQIAQNKQAIRSIFEQFLTFGDKATDALMVDNDDWLADLNYIDFLRDYGRHFSVNRMLSFDSVKLRLEREQPLSFLEFNYMILQAYDFLELNRRYDCILQMGGSDQWGNIVNGIELARRVGSATQQKQVQLYGLTTALLTTAAGAKMGKTAQGAVWLNENMLSPWDYWQFWRNTEDGDVGRFLRLFTELPLDDIARLEQLQDAELNEAKKILATEATALAHGRKAADKAAKTAQDTFEAGGTSANLPTVTVPPTMLADGLGVLEAFVMAGLAVSNSEARRLVQAAGARINDELVSDDKLHLTEQHVAQDGTIKLSAGKKRHVLLLFAK